MKLVFLEKNFLTEFFLIEIALYFKAYRIVFRLIYTDSKAVTHNVPLYLFLFKTIILNHVIRNDGKGYLVFLQFNRTHREERLYAILQAYYHSYY